MPVRSLDKGEAVVKQIQSANSGSDAGSFKLMQMDLISMQSVRNFAEEFKKSYKQLNILVCNAGAFIG